MPWVVHVGEHGNPRAALEIPKVLRHRAEREAAQAREALAIGIALPNRMRLSPPRPHRPGVWAHVERISWRDYVRQVTPS